MLTERVCVWEITVFDFGHFLSLIATILTSKKDNCSAYRVATLWLLSVEQKERWVLQNNLGDIPKKKKIIMNTFLNHPCIYRLHQPLAGKIKGNMPWIFHLRHHRLLPYNKNRIFFSVQSVERWLHPEEGKACVNKLSITCKMDRCTVYDLSVSTQADILIPHVNLLNITFSHALSWMLCHDSYPCLPPVDPNEPSW